MFSFVFHSGSCCLIGSRALVVPSGVGLGGRPVQAPWWRVLVGSALASGACRWRVRASARSFSGAVLVVGFRQFQAASVFAAAWGWWCGVSLAVRRFSSPAGAVWGVSVPVSVPPSLRLGSPLPRRGVVGWFRA